MAPETMLMRDPGRPRRRRFPGFVIAFVLVTAIGAGGLLIAARRAVDDVPRVAGVSDVLDAMGGSVENYLLVGSDSRANSDPSDPDFGGIGTEEEISGTRSDTIMVLRRDVNTGGASLLSIPRDLWVDVPGHSNKRRINSALNDGPATLVQTVQNNLQIPIHHYVEIDFSGFKDLVDAVGGVEVCFLYPTLDVNTGLNIPVPGCYLLNGVDSLAYARSRYYTEFRDGEWRRDGTADLGRMKRQQNFVNLAMQATIERVKVDPFATGSLVAAVSQALRVDEDLDPIDAASTLREAVGGGLLTYSLPVRGETLDGNSVLLLADGSDVVLDYFRGVGAVPPPDGGG